MQKLKISWCDIHRLSKLSGSLEDVDSRLDPKAGVPSLASGADGSCWYSAVDCKSMPSSRCVCHLLFLVWVISIIAFRHPSPSTLMNVDLTTSLAWVSSGKREETSVFSKTWRDGKSSQTQLLWLWPGHSACLSWCRVLVKGPSTIPKPFPRISSLTSTPGALCNPSSILLWKLKLIFNYAQILLQNVYSIIVNSWNIIIVYYLLSSYYMLLLTTWISINF